MTAILFQAHDPRGIVVVLEALRWVDQILWDHPWMKEEDVLETIENPYPPFIYQDKDYKERYLYYRLGNSRKYYTKVVVDFTDENCGKVVTAYITDSIKPGELMIWPKSKD